MQSKLPARDKERGLFCALQVHALDFSKGQGLTRLGQPISAPDRFHKLVWGSFRTEAFMVRPYTLELSAQALGVTWPSEMHVCIHAYGKVWLVGTCFMKQKRTISECLPKGHSHRPDGQGHARVLLERLVVLRGCHIAHQLAGCTDGAAASLACSGHVAACGRRHSRRQ